MNAELQAKFEKQLLEKNIFKNDRDVFNKDHKGVYLEPVTFFMYRVWVMQEATIEVLKENMNKKIEESFMLGYTEAEYDFWKSKEI